MMHHSSLKTRFLMTCCTFALLSSHAALAQTNSGQAPLLPPPPAEALQPIETSKPATVPVENKTETAAAAKPSNVPMPPAAETPSTNLGGGAAAAAKEEQQQAAPAAALTPVPVSTTPVLTTASESNDSIALPGMPNSEAALNSAPTGATTTLDPSLVGAASTTGYDQAAYEAQLKQRLADIKTETRAKAIEQAKDNMFPMKPDEIQGIVRELRNTQAAIQKPLDQPPPTPKAVVHTMELDPGATPPTIQLLNGNVTSLSILDATGQPWPIVDIAFGGPFDVKPPESGGHIIRISPLKEYAHGNMSIRLQKLATPLTFSLDSGGREVHYRFDARIPQLGPNAKAPLIDRGMMIAAGDDAILSAILVGTPPPNAERLKVNGVDGHTSAYRVGSSTYVRTPLTLLSPTWDSSASSADGTNVYVLGDVPVLLLSDNGTMVRAQLQQPISDPFGLPDSRRAVPTGLSQNNAGVRG